MDVIETHTFTENCVAGKSFGNHKLLVHDETIMLSIFYIFVIPKPQMRYVERLEEKNEYIFLKDKEECVAGENFAMYALLVHSKTSYCCQFRRDFF